MAKQQRRQQKGGAVLALSPAPFQVEAIKGGSGAAEYAISVYGNTDAQQAVAGSNVIQMQNPEAQVVPVVTGGNNNRNNNNNNNNNSNSNNNSSNNNNNSNSNNNSSNNNNNNDYSNNNNNQIGGQGILTDVAVPALLLYANNTFKRKNLKKLRKSIRKRKSKRYTRGKR